VAIPLTDLGATKTTITRIQLQENTGRNQPTRYLDNIGFERRVGAAPGVSISEGDRWRYFKGWSQPPSSWTSTRFDDSTWAQGRSGFGFGDGDDATVLNDMSGNYTSLYLRKTFDVSDPEAITSLVMTMDFDDGFVAYLNGTVVVRRNVPGSPPASNATAVEHHEASGGNDAPQPAQQYDLGAFGLHLLVPGKNVIAIQGHNQNLYSPDFSLVPTLKGS
jgi:hypothetical protein